MPIPLIGAAIAGGKALLASKAGKAAVGLLRGKGESIIKGAGAGMQAKAAADRAKADRAEEQRQFNERLGEDRRQFDFKTGEDRRQFDLRERQSDPLRQNLVERLNAPITRANLSGVFGLGLAPRAGAPARGNASALDAVLGPAQEFKPIGPIQRGETAQEQAAREAAATQAANARAAIEAAMNAKAAPAPAKKKGGLGSILKKAALVGGAAALGGPGAGLLAGTLLRKK